MNLPITRKHIPLLATAVVLVFLFGTASALYDGFFANSAVKPPKVDADNFSIYHQYTVTVPDRDRLQKFLSENDIGSAGFYPKPLHLQECFSALAYKQGDLPVTERLCGEVLSLPVYSELSPEHIEYVAGKVLEFYTID